MITWQDHAFQQTRSLCCEHYVNAGSSSGISAVQVKVQTQPGYAKGLMDGMPKLISEEGIGG